MIEIYNKKIQEIEMISVPQNINYEDYKTFAEDYLISKGRNPNDYIINY